MDKPAIFSATLGLSYPWQITAVTIVEQEHRMDITVDFYSGSSFTCPCCGSRCLPTSDQRETWFHQDFFHYTTYLHARVPHVSCCGATVAAERPWARTGSRFFLL